jgi:hypothetical protein
MLELQNFLKMKELWAENFGNFWKNITSPPPPLPTVDNIVRTNFLLSGKKLGGGDDLEGKGAHILDYTLPQPEIGWHALAMSR